MINPQTASLLEKLSKEPLFAEHKTILIGGTAMAYHVQHRVSFDLDLCFPYAHKLPKLSFLEDYKDVIRLEFDNFTKDSAANEGGDIDEHIKRYIINDVKVDFVINTSSNIYENQILKEDESIIYNNLRIASLKTIFKLKCLVMLDRNKVRDLYDVVYFLKYHNFTVEDMLNIIIKYRITYQPKDILRLIEAKKLDPYDYEGIEEAKMEMVEYDELKAYIVKALKVAIEA